MLILHGSQSRPRCTHAKCHKYPRIELVLNFVLCKRAYRLTSSSSSMYARPSLPDDSPYEESPFYLCFVFRCSGRICQHASREGFESSVRLQCKRCYHQRLSDWLPFPRGSEIRNGAAVIIRSSSQSIVTVDGIPHWLCATFQPTSLSAHFRRDTVRQASPETTDTRSFWRSVR